MRVPLRLLILTSIAVLGLRTWFALGVLIPCRVVSGSMAPVFRGPHFDIDCSDCGFHFACGADPGFEAQWFVCPNCGGVEPGSAVRPVLAGDGLFVSRAAFTFRRPERWEPVVLRHPIDAAQLALKRIVGLPGEEIEIRRGEIYADGRWRRKDWAAQRASAVLVHDARFQPKYEAARRWIAAADNSAWQFQGDAATCDAANSQQTDWLTYRHLRGSRMGNHEPIEEPIRDDDSYGQDTLRRVEDSHPVVDVMLRFRLLSVLGPGELVIGVNGGFGQCEVWLCPTSQDYRVLVGGDCRASGQLATTRPLAGAAVAVSAFDGQLILAVDDQPQVELADLFDGDEPSPTARPVSIGARDLSLSVCDLRVYRDVYYTRPVGAAGERGFDRPCRLGNDEYFVLGDNSAVSVDSRNWTAPPAVSSKAFIGKPLAAVFPMCFVRLWGWNIQVPRLAEMRYIP